MEIKLQNLFIQRASRAIFLFFIVCNLTNAKIIKQEISEATIKTHSYSDVCSYFDKKHLLLISAKDINFLDCMGELVAVREFCDNKYKNERLYLRGYIKDDTKEVVCQFGSRVSLSIQCTEDKQQYCKDDKIGCELLKNVFAKRLSLANSSLINKSEGKILNCHFLSR
jgi:hypothetical protein